MANVDERWKREWDKGKQYSKVLLAHKKDNARTGVFASNVLRLLRMQYSTLSSIFLVLSLPFLCLGSPLFLAAFKYQQCKEGEK